MVWKLRHCKGLQMRKIFTILTVVFTVIGMTGCGNSASANQSSAFSETRPAESSDSVDENESERYETDEYGRTYDKELGIYVYPPTESKDEEGASTQEDDRTGARPGDDEEVVESVFFTEHLRNQVFTKVSPFSEGRAWVQYLGASGETITSVINTNGEIVFTLDKKVDYYYDFHDGVAYYLYTPDPTKGREEYLDNVAVCIVDQDGNITYSSENSSIKVILAYGDGQFLAIEHISTFDVDEWRFGSIDKDGNTILEFKAFDVYEKNRIVYLPLYRSTYDNGSYKSRFIYLGDGIFYLNSDCGRIYNARENKVIDDYAIDTIIGNYQNGHMLYSGGGNSWGISVYDTDGYENIIKIRSNFDKSNVFLSGFSEDMCFYDHAYYDAETNVKIDFSKYADKKIAGGMFNQGYAPLYIEGADGKNYFTIIDLQGNELFTPILGSPVNSFSEGYLVVQLDSGCVLYNTDGEIILETPYNVNETMAVENSWLGGWYCNDQSYIVNDGYFIACKAGSTVPTIFVGVDGSYIGQ